MTVAERRKASPAAVSSTWRVVRRSSWTPTASSSWRMAMLSAGWLTNSRSAARVKLSSCATATK